MKNRDTVLVFSGGIDSVTMAYLLHSKGQKCRAIYVDYGKLASKRELETVKLVCLKLDMPLEVVAAPGVSQLQLGYLPYSKARATDLDIKADDTMPRRFSDEEIKKLSAIPAGSPNWFQLTGIHHLLSISTYLAQLVDINEIALGLTKEQASIVPGLKSALSKWSDFVKDLNPAAGDLFVNAPLIDMTKDEIVKLGLSLNVPYDITWSCFYSNDKHCGTCNQCLDRKDAFKKLGATDPIPYES